MDYEKAYNDLVRDIDLAIEGQIEGETKVVLQNIKERNMESEDERMLKDIRLVVESSATKYFKETDKMPEWYDRIVAFLEKQKVNTDGDFARGYDCGYECCLNSHRAEWLKKQKDASYAIEAVDRIDKYIDEHVANAHDMKDSNPDKKYYRGWDDALGRIAGILQDVYSDEKQKEKSEKPIIPDQKPILEVFGFKVGDAVRLKDGDGRKHIIKSFEEVEGIHGSNFYRVEFEDNSARDGIYPSELYPNGFYTQMEKFEEEQKSAECEKSLLNKFEQAVYDCAWGKVTCKPEGETEEEYAKRWAQQFLSVVRDWADDYIDFQIDSIKRKAYEKGKANAEKSVECIEFDNEFKNQISHLFASVLNKEWEYNKGFVEYAAQQLLGYAKHEIKPAECTEDSVKFEEGFKTGREVGFREGVESIKRYI